MGSVFRMAIDQVGPEGLAKPVVGLVARGGEPLDDEPVGSLMVGSERAGLPAELAARCDRLWTIPLRDGVESLNVAAAAALALGRISSAAP
jgi:TrmH family RNA methyltransferase